MVICIPLRKMSKMQNARSNETASKIERDNFLNFLLDKNKITQDTVARSSKILDESTETIENVLIKLGLIEEITLAQSFSEYMRIPQCSANDYPEHPILSDVLNKKFVHEFRFIPIKNTPEKLTIAMVNPLDAYVRQAVSFAAGKPVCIEVALATDFENAISRLYVQENVSSDTDANGEFESDAYSEDYERLRDGASDAPVIRLVDQLITQAVEARASDIHVEPMGNSLSIRLRIDGVLHPVDAPSRSLANAIVSRIKVMAKLNISERRLPQDGRILVAVHGKEIDFRISTTPTIHGESVVMRILDQDQLTLDLPALGYDTKLIEALHDLLRQPHGIVLATGPTGSGKTTTLYAALLELNTTEKKLLTIEDPVEYHLEGINQVQVKPKIGLTFASALRSFLRQDPDIMMVGEIRDLETAQVAVQSALTGHLILSTLHTNDAASAITRLRDMGIEDYLLTSTLNGVVAQRLVRTLCPKCREEYEPLPELLAQLQIYETTSQTFYRPRGCEYCKHTGYRGRSAIAEILPVTDPIRQCILKQSDTAQLHKVARTIGMRTMREHGIAKTLSGITSIDEVFRVTGTA